MAKRRVVAAQTSNSPQFPAKQIAGFIDKFEPQVARLIRACRSALRRRLPTAIEQVYDNYNFLAIGFCTTERTSTCICSLACSAKGVALSFYYGATLGDPNGILLGSGSQNRYVRLLSSATLRDPAVAALIDEAVANAQPPLPAGGRGKSVVKSVSVQQRPRRSPAGAGSTKARRLRQAAKAGPPRMTPKAGASSRARRR